MFYYLLNMLIYIVLLVVVISLLSSCVIIVDSNCVGRDFIRLDIFRIQFGVIIKNDIIVLMGMLSYIFELKLMGCYSLVYCYFSCMVEVVVFDQVVSWLQMFYFDLNEKFIGVDYVSFFCDDFIYFDIEKVSCIKQGVFRQ